MADKIKTTNMGNTNASKRKQLVKEALRDRIDGMRRLGIIEKLLDESWPAQQVPEIKAKLDAHFKLLGKVLPDLRSVEVSQDIDRQPEEMTLDEISAKRAEVNRRTDELAEIRRQIIESSAELDGVPGEPAPVH